MKDYGMHLCDVIVLLKVPSCDVHAGQSHVGFCLTMLQVAKKKMFLIVLERTQGKLHAFVSTVNICACIQHMLHLSVCCRDGRLQENDQILAIDGQVLESNISHSQAIAILQKASGRVELVVARGPPARAPDNSADRTPSVASEGSDMVVSIWGMAQTW